MRRIAIASAACFTLGAVVFAAQRLEVDVKLRPNVAQAREDSSTFWSESTRGTAATNGRNSFADLAERLSPAVVNIEVRRQSRALRRPEDMFEEFFGRRRQPRPIVPSSGTGFVIAGDGYIVTNDHVVAEAEEITVVFNSGNRLEAEVVGRDPKTDLALLKVDASDLAVAPLGDSDAVRVGDWVMAIGNPFGFDHTVTVGILSARGRNLNSGPYDDFLQTDASINPGNSGGPLIDMSGNVVGINTAIRAGAEGLGFAIPINMAKDLLPQLRATGTVTRGWLGVQIQRVTPSLAEEFGLDTPRGALISQVFDASPAALAELERGDVILQFNGVAIEDFDDLPRQVANTPPGSKVDVVVLRDGKERKLRAVVEKMKEDAVIPAVHESPGSDWGFDTQDLTPPISEQLGLDETTGVVITNVESASPAAEAGLQRGDVILELDRKSVKTTEDLAALSDEEDRTAVLLIRRGDDTLYIPIER